MNVLRSDVLRGVLTFHTETGTEGGYWAFQDERFIAPNTTRFSCNKCHLYWDKATESEEQVIEKGKRYLDANCTHDFSLVSPENWSYEGLRILQDGYHIKILSKVNPRQVEWEGLIELRQFELFTEHVGGLWMHADQVGVERDTWAAWFFAGNPAELLIS